MKIVSKSNNQKRVKLSRSETEVSCPSCGATIECRNGSGTFPCHECHTGTVIVERE